MYKHSSLSTYWFNLFQVKNKELNKIYKSKASPKTRETLAMIELIYHLYIDYRIAIDALIDNIEVLEEEVAGLRTATLPPETLTPIPYSPTKEDLVSTAGPKPYSPLNPLAPVPPFLEL